MSFPDACVGVIPLEFVETFVDRLVKFAPSREVTFRVDVMNDQEVCELWVSPGFGPRQLAAWNEIWWELKGKLSSLN